MREPTDLDNLQADYGPKSGRAAWPLLAVVHGSLLVGLAALAWLFLNDTHLEDSDASLSDTQWSEVGEAEPSVDLALKQAQSPRALQLKDHRVLASHMASVAMESGLFWVGLEIEPGAVVNGVQTVMANVGIEGPPFRLPIFIEHLSRFPALGVVEQIEAQAVGPDTGLFQIKIAYSAPVMEDTEWIGAAGHVQQDAVSTLEKAAGLQAWRVYSEGEAHREAKAIARADALVRAIPTGLWSLSRESRGFMWTPANGLQALGESSMSPTQ